MRAARWLPAAGIALAAGAFAWLNRWEVVMLDLGLFHLRRIPVSVLFFAAFLSGMLSMLLLGLRHDLRTRRLLRQHGLLDEPVPPAQEPDPAAAAADDDRDRTAPYPRYDETEAR